MTPPEVSIIIVTYHNEETIESCIASIKEQTSLRYEIIVVDNSLDRLTLDRLVSLRALYPELDVEIIRPSHNLGFAKACNLGARSARGKYLMFLNPDTAFRNDVARQLTAFMLKQRNAAVVGPLILDADGKVTPTCRNLPTVFRIFLDATGLDKRIGAYKLVRFSHATTREVQQIIGACFFISRIIFEALQGFDERFFIYFEEVDLCKRVLDEGYQVWFCPEARLIHTRGASTENLRDLARMIVVFRKSRTLYFEKHFAPRQRVLLKLVTRCEGLTRGFLYTTLWICSRKPMYREKARGYWQVALC
jgi:N-acetylglucosaminyl-diphospho-decaprenol L-rhamnosyltransferase